MIKPIYCAKMFIHKFHNITSKFLILSDEEFTRLSNSDINTLSKQEKEAVGYHIFFKRFKSDYYKFRYSSNYENYRKLHEGFYDDYFIRTDVNKNLELIKEIEKFEPYLPSFYDLYFFKGALCFKLGNQLVKVDNKDYYLKADSCFQKCLELNGDDSPTKTLDELVLLNSLKLLKADDKTAKLSLLESYFERRMDSYKRQKDDNYGKYLDAQYYSYLVNEVYSKEDLALYYQIYERKLNSLNEKEKNEYLVYYNNFKELNSVDKEEEKKHRKWFNRQDIFDKDKKEIIKNPYSVLNECNSILEKEPDNLEVLRCKIYTLEVISKKVTKEQQKTYLLSLCETYKDLFRLNNTETLINNNWGIALINLADYYTGNTKISYLEQACLRFEEESKINSKFEDTYLNWCIARGRIGVCRVSANAKTDYMQAVQILNKGLEINPNKAQTYYVLSCHQKYLASSSIGQESVNYFAQAFQSIKKACQLEPGNSVYLNYWNDLLEYYKRKKNLDFNDQKYINELKEYREAKH